MQRRQFLQFASLAAASASTTSASITFADAPSRESLVPLRRLPLDPLTGGSQAVVVDAVPLLHTPQVHAWDSSGKVTAQGASAQLALAWQHLVAALAAAQSSPRDLVRLHAYAANHAVVDELRRFIETQLDSSERPAISIVVGELGQPGSLAAFDAVAVAAARTAPARSLIASPSAWGPSASHGAILPAGQKLYVSGQAEKGASLADCTRDTMRSLVKTLEMFRLSMEQVVQIKSFLTPIANFREAESAIAAFFPQGQLPPLTFVEWKSTLPIEIELIAAVPVEKYRAGRGEPVEFHTPRGMSKSPIFSRVALTTHRQTIYTGSLHGKPGSGEAQVREIFARLGQIAVATGSDLKQLAKATYYVADDDTSRQLNAVRPEFYDAERPPAASKAMVAGVITPDRGIAVDLIAVPKQ